MSLNVSQYIERVRRLACQNQVKLDQADIESSLTVALQLLGEDLPKRPDFNRLQIDTAITFANGTADLSSQPAVLVDTISSVQHSSLGPLSFLGPSANRTDLSRASNAPYYRYVIEINKIHARHWDGQTAVSNGAGTITSNVVPSVDGSDNILIHASLEDELILKGFSLARANAAAVGAS